MHLRVGTAHTVRTRNGATIVDIMSATTAANSPVGVRGGTWTKKFLLWLVLLLQICFIGCYWLLQMGFNAVDGGGGVGGGGAVSGVEVPSVETGLNFATDSNNNSILRLKSDERVNFIRKAALSVRSAKELKIKAKLTTKIKLQLRNVNQFAKDFYAQTNRLNITEYNEDEMVTHETKMWCFFDGTLNETMRSRTTDEGVDLLLWSEDEIYEHCKCKPDWHGKDCGQPEVVWRALMTAKKPIKLREPRLHEAHRLIYLLEGNFFSLDLLELQIKGVVEVVDYFIIYLKDKNTNYKQLKALERRLADILGSRSSSNYVLYHCINSNSHIKQRVNCSAAHALAYFHKSIAVRPKPTDLFLYTTDQAILSHRALKFFKYYAEDVRQMRFRLKYTVYGFYWQHPQQTHLSGLISSYVHLDNFDSAQLWSRANQTLDDDTALVIGDLNHFGGWFCKYCQQPYEIIAELHAEEEQKSSSSSHVQFPNATRTHHIDGEYMQKLIANGIYVDGKTHLVRQRRSSDRYYAPVYAAENSWKFGNLLANLFESLDEDNEDDEAY